MSPPPQRKDLDCTMAFRVRATPAWGVDRWLRLIRRGGGRVESWETRGEILFVRLRTKDRERLRLFLGGEVGAVYSLKRINDH